MLPKTIEVEIEQKNNKAIVEILEIFDTPGIGSVVEVPEDELDHLIKKLKQVKQELKTKKQ